MYSKWKMGWGKIKIAGVIWMIHFLIYSRKRFRSVSENQMYILGTIKCTPISYKNIRLRHIAKKMLKRISK
ncbi:hypothetical protein FK004_17710 [Flavobacterium kingsejongi]|uniref:Uncharacterized protein n=1 Tax=Flavobacterium kingsejongi TaxID=1678728 RepID=A0A2S1LT60_9FLAO|nr:hypothetical protein FK004_17710 [Flavobacterium kingsejongi]